MNMILVTGATGFVGQAVVLRLLGENQSRGVAVALRRAGQPCPAGAMPRITGDLGATTDWSVTLRGVNSIVHCAARVHIMAETASDPLTEFRRVNVQGTLNLARQAAVAGIERFVFISSIKVNGETTKLGLPFSPDDVPLPLDPYGVSKMEAEHGLRKIAEETGMEVVIIRPPLVYGPRVTANFQAMMRWLARGVPLPLGRIDNRRSLVGLDNLVDLILTCIDHPDAANQTFLVSDGEDLSTTQLLLRMGQAMGKPARLVHVPPALLKLGAVFMGKPGVAQRLCGSLQVDISKTRFLLRWEPPMSVDEGLMRAAKAYLNKVSA